MRLLDEGCAIRVSTWCTATLHFSRPGVQHHFLLELAQGRLAIATEDNKASARRWSEALWNQANLAVAIGIVASDEIRHDGGDLLSAHGPAGVTRLVSRIRTMMPDLQIVIEDLSTEGDKVVSRYKLPRPIRKA